MKPNNFIISDEFGVTVTTARLIYSKIGSSDSFWIIYHLFKSVEYLIKDGCKFQYLDDKLLSTKEGTSFSGVFDLRHFRDPILSELFDLIYPYLV